MKYIAKGLIKVCCILLILLLSGCNKRKRELEVNRSIEIGNRSIEIEYDASNDLQLIVASFSYKDQNTNFAHKKVRIKIPRDSRLVYAGVVEGSSFFMISTSKKLYDIETDKVVLGHYFCSSDGYFNLKDFETSEIPPRLRLEVGKLLGQSPH